MPELRRHAGHDQETACVGTKDRAMILFTLWFLNLAMAAAIIIAIIQKRKRQREEEKRRGSNGIRDATVKGEKTCLSVRVLKKVS